MKRFLLIVCALAFSVSLANAQNTTTPGYTTNGVNWITGVASYKSLPINIAAATTTEIIPLVAGQQIFITSWDVMAGGTGNFTLVYGTGTNCGTGTTSLTGAYPLIAQAGISKGNGLGAILTIPPGNALCATVSTSVQMSGSVAYAQY